MKYFYSIICIILFVSTGYGQEKNNSIKLGLFSSHPFDFEYVNGKVKEIHYQTFHITNEDGKIVKGKPITIDESQYVELRQPWSYYYNEHGQLVKSALRIDERDPWISVVNYNNDRIEKIYWLRNDTLYGYQVYVYLDNGDMARQWIRIQDNQPQGKTIYNLDKNGNVLKSISSNEDGEVTYTWEYTRDDDGKIKSYKGFDAEGKLKHYFIDYQYNEKGLFKTNLMKILNYEEVDQQAGEIEYKYDEHGNWIKRISPGWIMIERTIEYYN